MPELHRLAQAIPDTFRQLGFRPVSQRGSHVKLVREVADKINGAAHTGVRAVDQTEGVSGGVLGGASPPSDFLYFL